MSDPLSFLSATPRLGLPLLYAGQAQKEVTVNEALVGVDFILHGSIEGVSEAPPADPAPGQAWIVGTSPSGAWSGRSGQVAGWTESGWRFVSPVPGMRLFDRGTEAYRLYNGTWQAFAAPALPSGGSNVDVEARAAVAQLVAVLAGAGIFVAA